MPHDPPSVASFGSHSSVQMRQTPNRPQVHRSLSYPSASGRRQTTLAGGAGAPGSQRLAFSYDSDEEDEDEDFDDSDDEEEYIPLLPARHGRSGKNGPAYEIKLAFLGDQGLGEHPRRVLRMVRDWGAQALVQLGDFDYEDDPRSFMHQFSDALGKRFPLFAVVGNHDVAQWFTNKSGYRDRLTKQAKKAGTLRHCTGEIGVNMVCTFNDIVLVLSGVGTLGTNHAEFIDKSLSKHRNAKWKICVWHKNQSNYQTGDKKDETGYEVYETCRRHGALIFTSHDHSYARSHLMSNFENATVASENNTLHVRPGYTFVGVSGLGGDSIRYWKGSKHLNPWWAATAAMDNGANYGALLCTFNAKGKIGHATCKFKDIDGHVWDRFKIVSSADEWVESQHHSSDDHGFGTNRLNIRSGTLEIESPPPAPAPVLATTRLTDTPVMSLKDATSTHLTVSHATCADRPSNLMLSRAASASDNDSDFTIHTLTFYIPAPNGRITHTHLQMMATHPSPSFVAQFTSRAEAYQMFANSTDIALTIWDVADPPACDYFGRSNLSSSPHQHQHALGPNETQLSDQDNLAHVPSNAVVWAREDSSRDEPWESGEVHVSPNLAHLIKRAIQRQSTPGDRIPITLAIKGRWWFTNTTSPSTNSSLDFSRGFYLSHEYLGSCVAPSLIVQTDTSINHN